MTPSGLIIGIILNITFLRISRAYSEIMLLTKPYNT